MVRITCPADCAYLDPNSDYQQKRIGERFAQARREFYKRLFELGGEKAAAFFKLIEVVCFSYFLNRRDGQDAEIVAGIHSLRRTISPLHIPNAPQPVFAEHLKKEYEAYVKQDPQQTLDNQTKTDVLDQALTFVQEFSGPGLQSQRFLTGLIGYIKTHHPAIAEHLAKQQETGRIVLPTQLSQAPSEPPGHIHTHHDHR